MIVLATVGLLGAWMLWRLCKFTKQLDRDISGIFGVEEKSMSRQRSEGTAVERGEGLPVLDRNRQL